MMRIENKENCTGCGACFNICPQNVISINWDNYGFYKPSIDSEGCINCGLCEKICPLGKTFTQDVEPKVFAIQNKDKEILYKCASGGAFALLSKQIIEQGGVVYGVIYDAEMKVCHSKTETIDGLDKMYSSKYVQSNTKNTFQQAKDDLKQGRFVLYSGTPCQIAGLKSFLQHDYDNLLTADLVCHGTPSPKIFEIYKKEFMQKRSSDECLLNIDFRSKIQGWSPSLVTTTTTTTTTHASKDDFMQAFLSNLSINNSCLHCKFNKLPRVADLSLGDFWGVDSYDKSMNDNKGLSIVLINSSKGKHWFNKIKSQAKYRELPIEIVVKHNPNICGSSKPHPQRDEFFTDIKKGITLKSCVKKYCKVPLYIALYRLLPQFAKNFIKYNILKMEK